MKMNGIVKRQSPGKLVDLAYILGVTLVISALVYFFAANWGGLERSEKVGLITILVLGFYGLAFLLERVLSVRPLVGKLAFFSGVLAFGVSVALLGQVYNSHADSYLLFLVWLVPALLFSLITRYQHFDLLSYILVHATFAFYLFPTAVSYYISDEQMLLSLLTVSALNLILFGLLRKKLVNSPVLEPVSLIVFHSIWLGLTAWDVFPHYAFILHVAYHLIVLCFIYTFIKKGLPRYGLMITVFAYAFYLFESLVNWMFFHASELIFIFIILMAIALITLTVYLFRWVARKMNNDENGHERVGKHWWQTLIVEVVSLFSALLIVGAVIGLTGLLFFNLSPFIYYGIGMMSLLSVIFIGKQIDAVISHTMIYVGLMFSTLFSWELSFIFLMILLVLLPFVWEATRSPIVRTMIYFSGNLLIVIETLEYNFALETSMLVLLFLNVVMLFSRLFVPSERGKRVLTGNALFYSLLFAFVLTFLYRDVPVVYYLVNGLYFLVTTYFGFRYVKEDRKDEARIVFIFWFIYVAYKYYDIVWTLLHKSIALFIIGLIFLALALFFDQHEKKTVEQRPLIWQKKLPIIVVIVLQVAFIGYQYTVNENILTNGTLIKLKLEPIDPRSLLQGDYVRLNYSISHIDDFQEDVVQSGGKVTLVLAPDKDGFYEYTGVYKHRGQFNVYYEGDNTDVLINAKLYGSDHLIYGIESYFIEEGTGTTVEQQATTAYVKVAANGNAILEKIE